MLYMTSTDGQVTIKFIDDQYHFSSNIKLDNQINSSNLSIINFSVSSPADILYQLHRYYDDSNSMVKKIHIFNYILIFWFLPIANILYALSLVIDFSLWKDLYTRISFKIWGVQK